MDAKFAFNQLSDDCLFDVFKYLPFKERTRFERINGQWAEVLASVWRLQRVLFCSHQKPTLSTRSPCPETRHSIRGGDVFREPIRAPGQRFRQQIDVYETSSFKILKKCDNLLALYWNLPYGDADFGLRLATICPDLEHLFFSRQSKRKPVNMLLFVENVKEVKIKCFDWLPPNDEAYETMLTLCPRLVTLVIYGKMVIKGEAFAHILPQLKHLMIIEEERTSGDGDAVGYNELRPLLVKDQKLEFLAFLFINGYQRKYSDEALEAVGSNFTLLKSLNIALTSFQVNQGKRLPNIEEVVLFPANINDGLNMFAASLESLLKDRGSSLKRVIILSHFQSCCQLVAEYCPNLIYFKTRVNGTENVDLTCFTKCPKLRELKIKDGFATGLNLLLESCPKIRKIKLGSIKKYGEGREMVKQMKDYSKDHPKRSITFDGFVTSNEVKRIFPSISRHSKASSFFWSSVLVESYNIQTGVSGNFKARIQRPLLRGNRSACSKLGLKLRSYV